MQIILKKEEILRSVLVPVHEGHANILQTLCKMNAKPKAWQNGGKHVLLQPENSLNV